MSQRGLHAEGSIPRNILQFWHDKAQIPREMQEALDGTRQSHRDYRMWLADDAEIRALLTRRNDTALLLLYGLLRLPSSRSDLARLVLLHEYGGFYLDVSMQLHTSLSPHLAGDPELIVVRRDDMPRFHDCPEEAHVMGGILAAPPRSPFIEGCLQLLLENLVSGARNTEAWHAAGPGVINRTLQNYQTRRLIKKLSFREMLAGSVSYRRSPGISNAWVEKQKDGIIDPAVYAAGPLQLEKS